MQKCPRRHRTPLGAAAWARSSRPVGQDAQLKCRRTKFPLVIQAREDRASPTPSRRQGAPYAAALALGRVAHMRVPPPGSLASPKTQVPSAGAADAGQDAEGRAASGVAGGGQVRAGVSGVTGQCGGEREAVGQGFGDGGRRVRRVGGGGRATTSPNVSPSVPNLAPDSEKCARSWGLACADGRLAHDEVEGLANGSEDISHSTPEAAGDRGSSHAHIGGHVRRVCRGAARG